jgi:hypothetical protein
MNSASSALVRGIALLLLVSSTSGCRAIAGIFRAGFWTGIIFAVLIIVGVMILFRGRR